MSAVVGVFNARSQPIDPTIVHRMLDAMGSLGRTTSVLTPEPGAMLAVARHDWERDDALSGPVLVLNGDDVAVAADASVYYRRDLVDRLAMKRVQSATDDPGALIHAAYRAWGEQCPEALEGDYAFIVYDRHRRGVFCARDIAGRRPLFYADLGDTLVVASSVSAILAHPECPDDLNLAAVGASAAFMRWSWGTETCYAAIQVVPMAGTLSWRGSTRVGRHWTPEAVGTHSDIPFEQAAAKLREMFAQAVYERLSPRGQTAVWMSGGRDSTAVFAAGQHALSRANDTRQLTPVSISYPPGDMGREDELIEAVATRWDARVHWLDIDGIPLFHRDQDRARKRDEPAASPYENVNRALADGARAIGARVALDGNGGDLLFSGTDIFLSDLLGGWRWRTLVRELRRRRARGWRHLFEATVQPLLPQAPLRYWARLSGGTPPKHYLERPIAAWMEQEFVERHDLLERERALLPQQGGETRSEAEHRWWTTLPFVGYMQGLLQPGYLEAGVQARSPLLDRRIVEFALGRPPWERVSGTETKRLLRVAMRGLIPAPVLAPRRVKTGLTLSYSRQSMKRAFPELFEELYRSPLILAELGVVDPARLRDSVSRCARSMGEDLRVDLFYTLQTELWLRARLRNESCCQRPMYAS